VTWRAALLATFLLVAPPAARAASGCTVTLSINFGGYDVFAGGALTWSGNLSYSCTGNANGPIYIDLGAGTSGTYAQRQAASGASRLGYNVYTDPSFSTVWGDGNGGTGEYVSYATPGNNTVYLVPVYGRITPGQDVAVGTYADTLTATIYWTKKQVTNSATTSVTISASVISKCSIATIPLDFGAYDPVLANATTAKTATGAVTTTCTRGAATTIGLDAGRNPSGAQRQMTDGAGHVLAYGLFQDGAHAIPWENAGAGLLSPPAAPSFGPRTFTVYGQIPAGQDAFAASYGDTVTATVTY
jgi:spore coat protein U-like protein